MKRREFINAAALTAGSTMFMGGSTQIAEAQQAFAGAAGRDGADARK